MRMTPNKPQPTAKKQGEIKNIFAVTSPQSVVPLSEFEWDKTPNTWAIFETSIEAVDEMSKTVPSNALTLQWLSKWRELRTALRARKGGQVSWQLPSDSPLHGFCGVCERLAANEPVAAPLPYDDQDLRHWSAILDCIRKKQFITSVQLWERLERANGNVENYVENF